MTDAQIGVVVIGRNEGARLVACLASLRPIGLPVVYVDSGSTDGSRDVAREAGAAVVALDLARPFTAARARNEGAAALTHAHPGLRFVQFVDGDCTVAPGWIGAAAAFLTAEPRYAAACGRRRERFPDASLYNRLADIEWATPVGDALSCGGDALFRLEAFGQVGGYDAGLIAGEEPELCSRLRAQGWSIRRLDEEMTAHDMAMHRVGQWWRRSVRAGFAYAEVSRMTARHGTPVFVREERRALAWGIGIPAATIALALTVPWLAWLPPLILAAQVARLTWRRRRGQAPLGYAALMTLGKFAETEGILRYWRARLGRGRRLIIEYR